MISLQFVLAIAMAGFVGGVTGYIGSLMVTTRMALMGGALGHLTLPGIALALVYDFDVSVGALLFLILGIILIWLFEQKTQLPVEALTAVVFASSLAIAFLFLPEGKSIQALIGDVSRISVKIATITIILSIIIFLIIRKIFSGLVIMSISSDIARVMHINIKRYNLIYLMSIAVVVALGVRIVGGLMTAALLAIPACTSKNLSKSLCQYSYGSLVFGCLASVLGTGVFLATGIPAGPMIIIFSSFLFLISVVLKK